MDPDAIWRLYSGVNFLATSLSRMAMKLEQPLSDDERTRKVAPQLHAMVREASQLLPLFHQYADALAAAVPADVEPTGFQALPTEVQRNILELAAADSSTAAALRRVNRSFEAHDWIRVRSETYIDLAAECPPLTLLPYLPRLDTITCSGCLDLPSTRFVDAVLAVQLPAWPHLVALHFAMDGAHVPTFPHHLAAASHLTSLTLDVVDANQLGDWPQAIALALPELQNLQMLSLYAIPPGHPEPHLCEHLSALTRLTDLAFEPTTSSGAAVFSRTLSSLSALTKLLLISWPSSAAAADHSAWHALMDSLCNLRRLANLDLNGWQLDAGRSAGYFSELGPTITSLRALTRLTLDVDPSTPQTARNRAAAAADSTAGAALVQAIGTRTQLRQLALADLQCVDVSACCQHLACLTKLTQLTLDSLNITAPPVMGAPAAPLDTFEQLLAGMTRLRTLKLESVGLRGRLAMRVFSEVVPTLVQLKCLCVGCNSMGTATGRMLAHSACQLPGLVSVSLSEGNNLVAARDGVPGDIADMNWIVRRCVFE